MRRQARTEWWAALGLLGLGLMAGAPVHAQSALDCFGEDNERRISGCSEIITQPGISPDELSTAYAMRGLGYSLKGLYDHAMPDYDRALDINPDFAVALNNRAWAYFKSGRARQGLPDVEKSLALAPASPHTFDTRAHIRQTLGNPAGALADYEMAMRLGGDRMIKLYQCGLQAHGLYDGYIDGVYTRKMREGLVSCINSATCDPLPASEECQASTS